MIRPFEHSGVIQPSRNVTIFTVSNQQRYEPVVLRHVTNILLVYLPVHVCALTDVFSPPLLNMEGEFLPHNRHVVAVDTHHDEVALLQFIFYPLGFGHVHQHLIHDINRSCHLIAQQEFVYRLKLLLCHVTIDFIHVAVSYEHCVEGTIKKKESF